MEQSKNAGAAQAAELRERVKELNCLYRVSQAVGASSLSLEAVLHDVANIIPSGWQFPSTMVARLEVLGRVYGSEESAGRHATGPCMREPILLRGEPCGEVSIGYSRPVPSAAAEAFLPEEIALLRAIASMVTRLVERRMLEMELAAGLGERQVLAERQLSGFIPVCASCKNIRDDEGSWLPMELYIQQRTQATFSHSICPPCKQVLYPKVGDT